MCSATLGAGALSLPYAISQMGLLLGLGLLAATACATHYSISLLVGAMGATRLHSFEELTVHAFGQRVGVLVEVAIIAFCFGTVVAYTVAIGDILEPVLAMRSVQRHLGHDVLKQHVLFVLWLVVMLPLSLAESLSAFEASSAFGVLSLLYLVLSVAYHAAADCSRNPQETIQQVELARFGPSGLSSLAILLFAFTCQVNVPSMFAELQPPNPATMRHISRRAVLLCLGCYALIGTAGYVNFPHKRESNVLSNYELDEPHSRMMAPSFGAIALTVLMAYPLNVFPCRYTLDVILSRSAANWSSSPSSAGFGPTPIPPRRRALLTLLITGASLLIALFVPGINIVFQLMGGTASAFVCFILPAAFAWHYDLPEVRSRAGKLACASLFLVGCAVSVLSTTVTLAEMASTRPPPPAPPSRLHHHLFDDRHDSHHHYDSYYG